MHMTQAKKLKRAIRARSRKTGESYTAARRHVVKGRTAPAPASSAAARPTPRPKRTPGGQVTEAAARSNTGHGLEHWFAVLDAFGAVAKGHTASARHLHDDHGIPGWYSQGITVAYERERGLRAVNQACSGDFQVSVSRAVPASLAEAADAIGNPARRRVWLRGADPGLAAALNAAFTGARPRSVRIKNANNANLRYPWDETAVEISILGKPNGGVSVVAVSTKLRDGRQVEQRRAQWKLVLDALKAHLMS
jgi:hypothetical protein